MRESTYVTIFFYKDPATPNIYPLTLHHGSSNLHQSSIDAMPAFIAGAPAGEADEPKAAQERLDDYQFEDRKSTRLNSSHSQISYAVFFLKKNTKSSRPRYNTFLH